MLDDMKFRNAVNGFNKNDVMACIESLLQENANQKKKIKDLEDALFLSRSELEQVKADSTAKDMCEQCDAAKAAQAQLGAAMLDAKRFSELLLKDANDRSAQVLNNAADQVADSTVTATALSDALKTAKENFIGSLDSLQDELTAIILSFMEFRTDLDKKGQEFKFTTDFAGDAK